MPLIQERYSDMSVNFDAHSLFARKVIDNQTGTVSMAYDVGPATNHSGTAYAGGACKNKGQNTFTVAPLNAAYVPILDANSGVLIVGPQHGEGSSAFIGAVGISEDLSVLIPNNSQYMGHVNPRTLTYKRGGLRPFAAGYAIGGIHVGVNDEGHDCVVISPGDDGGFLWVYDCVAQTFLQGPSITRGGRGTLLPDGNVMLAGTNMIPIIYDWRNNVMVPWPAVSSTSNSDILLSIDGEWLISVPYAGSRPWAYNRRTGADFGIGAALPAVAGKYNGGAPTAVGAFAMAPYNASEVILVYPPSATRPTGEVVVGPTIGAATQKFSAAVTDDFGIVWFIPVYSANFGKLTVMSGGEPLPSAVVGSSFWGSSR